MLFRSLAIAANPIHIFLDFNAVIVNLDSLTPDGQKACMESIENSAAALRAYLEENLREKENIPEIPETGMAVLRQQLALAEAIENWVASFKKTFCG